MNSNSGSTWDNLSNYTGSNPFSTTNDLNFSSITSSSTVTLTSTTTGTVNAGNIFFGTTSSGSNPVNVNFDGTGVAGQTVLNLGTGAGTNTITLSSVSGAIDTFGSDLTIHLGGGYQYFGFAANANVTAAPAVAPVMVVNSLVTGGGANASMFLNYSQYGSASAQTGGPTVVFTNNSNTFVSPISIVGSLYFTSIADTGVASSLGAASGTLSVNTIALSNGGKMYYIGSGDQTTNRGLKFGGTDLIGNYASTPSNLAFTGTVTETSTQGTSVFDFVDNTGNTITFNGAIFNGTGGNVQSVTKLAGTNYVNTSGAVVTNTDGSGTLVLAGLNAYSGVTTINAGVLSINSIANGGVAFTTSTSTTTGINTVTVSSAGGLAAGEAVTGNGVGYGATIQSISGNTLTLSVNNTATVATSTVTIGTPNALGISSNAAANLVLGNGTLQYTGPTASTDRLFTISGTGTTTATLDASGTGPVSFTNTGSLAYGTAGTTASNQVRQLYLTGTNTGANTLAANIANNGAATNGNSNVSVTKNGIGSWTLSGSNTYTGGTAVNAGSLFIANTSGSALGTGSLTVAAGATFGGPGSATGLARFNIGNVSGSQATLLVGTGTDVTSSLTLAAGAASTINNTNLQFNINNAGSGNQLKVGTTALSFSGDTLTLNLSPGVIPLDTPYILVAGIGGNGAGTLAGSQYGGGSLTQGDEAPNGLGVLVNGFTLDFNGAPSGWYSNSYVFLVNNGTVDDIEIEVVPEPSTWALMFGGLGMLVLYIRRKNAQRPFGK